MSWKWRLIAAVMGLALWSPPAMAAKIDRFTDQEGTLHISNLGKEEPIKPGAAPSPSPRPGSAPQPQASPLRAPARPGRVTPSPPAIPDSPEPPPDADPEMPPPPPEADDPNAEGLAPEGPDAAATPGEKPRPPRPLRMPPGKGTPPVAGPGAAAIN